MEKSFQLSTWRRIGIVLAFLGLAVLGWRGPVAKAAPLVRSQFVSLSGATLPQLDRGVAGSGLIRYFLSSEGPRRPQLIVKIDNRGKDDDTAYVYQPPPQFHFISATRLPTLFPTIILRAQGGWWVRNGVPNYSLHVDIYAPMYAMWGAPDYLQRLKPGHLAFRIRTFANAKGVPVWDLRSLAPTFPHSGYLRSNYAQTECGGPLVRQPSPSPLWPYVAFSGAFEQQNGKLTPPIVVNWNTGQITAFSEIVTVRNQNCSYDVYSLTPIHRGRVNAVDFEAPWGFYDLSGTGQGFPNLIVRSGYFYANDPWAPRLPSATVGQLPPPATPASNVVRYSWADHPGNQEFNYKVDLFGLYPYEMKTPIAGGHTWILAPSYSSYPKWVVQHRWPSMTFVDTNGGGYQTSEGIYDWPSGGVGTAYYMGASNHPHTSQYTQIRPGFRGEYRIGVPRRPLLYMSPIDNQFHLLHAQGGLWNLGRGMAIQETNLTQGPYLDAWKLVRTYVPTLSAMLRPHRIESAAEPAQVTLERFWQLPGGYLLYEGPQGVILRKTSSAPSLFTIAPPSSPATWRYFVRVDHARLVRNPLHLSQWIEAWKGPSAVMGAAAIHHIVVSSSGFQLMLALPSGVHPRGSLVGHPIPSQPGQYLLQYRNSSGTWSVKNVSPPHLQVTERPSSASAYLPVVSTLTIKNTGQEAWQGALTFDVYGASIFVQVVRIGGQHTLTVPVRWVPQGPGRVDSAILAGGRTIWTGSVMVRPTLRPTAEDLWKLSAHDSHLPLSPVLAGLFLVVMTTATYVGWKWGIS